MDKKLYNMIFKRKSFHLFRNIGNEHLTEDELKDIEIEFSKLKPLVDKLDSKHIYEKSIYNDYISNNSFNLTDKQLETAYNIYKNNK
jgi:predicted DNA binding protein